MRKIQIACLMTCHNRKDATIACLESLMNQESIDNIEIEIFLVDDGCTDGTVEVVTDRFENINILRGNGQLYWCGGMRLAFGKALTKDFDFYLWLNNDIILLTHAINVLYETSTLKGPAIIIGSLQESQTGRHSYGGVNRHSKWPPFRFDSVLPTDKPVPCDSCNGNLVLIPKAIAHSVGNLSAGFTHGIGDYDYGLRAQKQGFSCWIAPGYLGYCSRNSIRGTARDASLPFEERLKKMTTPVDFAPLKERMLYYRRHAGFLWPIECLLVLGRICFPRLWLLTHGQKPKD